MMEITNYSEIEKSIYLDQPLAVTQYREDEHIEVNTIFTRNLDTALNKFNFNEKIRTTFKQRRSRRIKRTLFKIHGNILR